LRRGSEIRWKKIVRSARLACGASLLSITLFALPVAGVANDDYAARMGTVYTTGLADTSPHIKQIALPKFPGADAVWGSSGRDHRGHIWIGVSADGGDLSAHLIEFVPETGDIIDRGDVVSELKKAGIYRDGESQVKIHTKIIEAADGYLYFAARSDDMIISAGYNIAGPEVEAALLAHEDVAECGVIGAPDEARGAIVEAHVVLKDGVEASPAQAKLLQDFVKARIAP